jgi:5'-3' exonuclease
VGAAGVSLPAPAPPLYLVDASLYVFRAWHSMPADGFHDADGWPTNAVHGFVRFLLDLLERERPRHIAIAFDEALDSCFRNTLYPAYKANRDPAPAELKRQFAYCKALCAALGLPVLAHREYEADDLIGAALVAVRREGFRGVIVSADKDLSQLLKAHDEQWDYVRGQRWGADGVKARHGVHAHQIADYLALCGDAVDNIPGVPGVGSKTAAVLLGHFGSLDALLDRMDEVAFLRMRGAATVAARLREHRAQALLYRQLSTIACDAPLLDAMPPFARAQAEAGTLAAFADAVGFGPMTRRRLEAFADGGTLASGRG